MWDISWLICSSGTPPGRRLIDLATEPHLHNERRLLAALSPAEQRTLAGLLRKLLLSLEG